ncbi:MAG TPA: type 1 glutamine amidotransferase [Kaistiaceae bacterium]|nr:type 1 glutamine amidotransferase [Kaistiaceae bacterium]
MRLLVVENWEDSPLGLIEPLLAARGVELDMVAAHLGQPLPTAAAGHDGMIVLGGAQSAVDDEDYPYLPQLADLTRRFGEADKAVLGICLGCQLAARGHGGRNVLSRPIEFGYHEVRPTEAGRGDPVVSAIGAGVPLLHFHTDTVTLPQGAVHLAASDMTPIQAFRTGRAVYGLQFHFEATPEIMERWADGHAWHLDEQVPGWRVALEAGNRDAWARTKATGEAITLAWLDLV